MKLDSTRLELRRMEPSDAEALFDYRSDEITNKYQGWIPKSLEEVQSFLQKLAPDFNVPDTWFQFAIIEKEGGNLIGDLGVHFIDEHQVELGCTLNKKFQGRGFANEALTVVINHLFIDLKKHRISGSIDPNNTGSILMMERLGFRKEAHFKESYLHHGQWVDDVVYGLLSKEWNKD